MFHITVKGIKSHKRRQFIKLATQHMLASLVNHRMHIDLEIQFCELAKRENGIIGLCDVQDHGRNPRMFIVEIDSNISFFDQLLTIAHELVHVKQFAKNELYQYCKNERTRWRNKVYDKLSYSKQPWEREAYRKQYKILHEFVTKHSDICWLFILSNPDLFNINRGDDISSQEQIDDEIQTIRGAKSL